MERYADEADRPPIILQYSRRGKKSTTYVKGDEKTGVVIS